MRSPRAIIHSFSAFRSGTRTSGKRVIQWLMVNDQGSGIRGQDRDLGRHGIARFFDCKCNFGLAIPLGSGAIQTNWFPKKEIPAEEFPDLVLPRTRYPHGLRFVRLSNARHKGKAVPWWYHRSRKHSILLFDRSSASTVRPASSAVRMPWRKNRKPRRRRSFRRACRPLTDLSKVLSQQNETVICSLSFHRFVFV